MRDLVGFLLIGGQYNTVKFKIRTLNSLTNTHWSPDDERILVFYKFQDGIYPWIYTKRSSDLLTQTPFNTLEDLVWTQVPAPGEVMLPGSRRKLAFVQIPTFSGLRAIEFETMTLDALSKLHLRREKNPQNLSIVRQENGQWRAIMFSDGEPSSSQSVFDIDALQGTVWERTKLLPPKPKNGRKRQRRHSSRAQ